VIDVVAHQAEGDRESACPLRDHRARGEARRSGAAGHSPKPLQENRAAPGPLALFAPAHRSAASRRVSCACGQRAQLARPYLPCKGRSTLFAPLCAGANAVRWGLVLGACCCWSSRPRVDPARLPPNKSGSPTSPFREVLRAAAPLSPSSVAPSPPLGAGRVGVRGEPRRAELCLSPHPLPR
jgi:hypothetical protein